MIAEEIEIAKPCRYNGVTRIATFQVRPKERSMEELALEKADRIANYVFLALHVDRQFIFRASRTAEVVKAKRIAIALISYSCGLKDHHLAKFFNLDRTTVVYHRNTFNDLVDTDRRLKEFTEKLRHDLKLK